jgi:glycosyltransferase involved in cell wall biosynthesis
VNKLYYLGQPGDGFGWGVANTNLVRSLSKLCTVEVTTWRESFDAPVFSPIWDHSLEPKTHKFDAPRKLGYCFTEWPIPYDAHRNARFWDVVFAGSNWNAKRLMDAGVKRVQVLQQGVDFERFHPGPAPDKGFVVFSGGKYEFRKGQDYVIAAMRHFMTFRKDAILVAAWHNPWPATMRTMEKSWLIKSIADQWEGFDMSRVVLVPGIPNEKTADMYRQSHIGLFPNRCEAGTNLVMSEYMACGRPVIATYAHGHADVLDGDGPYHLVTGSTDPAGWFNPNVSDILYYLEHAYTHQDELPTRGEQCRKLIEPFTWEQCAQKIYAAAFEPDRGSQSQPVPAILSPQARHL